MRIHGQFLGGFFEHMHTFNMDPMYCFMNETPGEMIWPQLLYKNELLNTPTLVEWDESTS